MAAEHLTQFKTSRVAGVAPQAWASGMEASLWQFDGMPSGGAAPTTWAIPDNTTVGGMLQANPTAGLQKWLTGFFLNGNAGRYVLYDRLLHVGGFDGTIFSPTAQLVNGGAPAAPTRYPNGVGNTAFLEVYSTVGGTVRTASVAYTDENGVAATSTVTFGGSGYAHLAQTMARLANPPGNPGVRDVTSVTLSNTTNGAGNFGLVIAHEIASFEVSVNGIGDMGAFLDADVEILANACLAWTFIATAPVIAGSIPLWVELDFVDK